MTKNQRYIVQFDDTKLGTKGYGKIKPENLKLLETKASWYDKYRKCEDGNSHEGELELVTWNFETKGEEPLGWGAVIIEEAEEHKENFEKKC